MEKLQKQRADGKITRQQFLERKRSLMAGTKNTAKPVKAVAKAMPMLKNMPTPQMLSQGIVQTSKSLSVGGAKRVNYGSNPYAEYLRCLVDPAGCTARIPDAYPRETATFTTIQSFDVPLYNDAFSEGKFSFALRPILGDFTSPTHYQCAVSNTAYFNANSISWDSVNWSDVRSYITTNGQGKDIRVDPNAGVLTTPPPSFYGTTFNVGTSTDLAPNTLISNVAPQTNKFGDATVEYPFTSSGNVNPIFPPAGGGAPYQGGAVVLPFGDWAVSVSAKFQASAIPGSGFAAVNFLNYGPNQGQIGFAAIQQPQTVIAATGVTYTVAATMQVVSRPGANILSFGICSDQTDIFTTSTSLISGTVSACTITISPANFATSSAYLSGGIIEAIRPVSMATLVTYMGTTLNNGGEIVANYLDPQLIANNFFQTNTGGLGQLQNHSNLRQTKGAHDGPLKDGTYCIWAPYDADDLSFRSPSDMNSHDYPGIVVSGVFVPDSAVVNPQSVLRTFVWVTYEYTTKYTCIGTKSIPGSTECTEAALQVLKQARFATMNKNHLANIKMMLRKGYEWYKQNSAVINPALMALGSAFL